MDFFDSKECEWSQQRCTFAGAPLSKLTNISYKAAKAKEHLHAEGDEPIGIQSGNRTYDGTIEVLKGALDDMNKAAKAAGGRDILDLEFDIVNTFQPAANRPMQQDLLVGVQITEYQKGWEQGAKNMKISLPVLITRIDPVY